MYFRYQNFIAKFLKNVCQVVRVVSKQCSEMQYDVYAGTKSAYACFSYVMANKCVDLFPQKPIYNT